MRFSRVLVACALASVALSVASTAVAVARPHRPAVPAPDPAVGTGPSHFVAVAPFRLVDTRSTSPIAARGSRTFAASGQHGIPSSGVAALDLTISAVAPTATGTVTAWAAGATKPTTTSLRFAAGRPASVHAIVQLSDDGRFSLANTAAAGLNVAVDVTGYYASGTGDAGTYVPLTPSRIVDTRTGTGVAKKRVAAGGGISAQVTGRGGVPSTISSVVVSLSALAPAKAGSLVAYAAGTTRPATTNLTFAAGHDAADLAVLPVSTHGLIGLHNNGSGPIDITVDVVGYYLSGSPSTAGAINYVTATRVLDTRSGAGGNRKGAIPGGGAASFTVAGKAGVPAASTGHVVVVGTLTAVDPTHSGAALAYPGGSSPTSTTSLQFTSGTTASDLVALPLSGSGALTIANRAGGAIHYLFDVVGYYLRSDLAVPAAATSHNIRVPKTTAGSRLQTLGGSDAQADSGVAGSKLHLLHIGAQTVKNLNGKRGVLLSGAPTPDTAYRYTDAELVAALEDYLDGYHAAAPGRSATIVVDTNSDGTFVSSPASIAYTATQKGDDWARSVIIPLRAYAAAHAPTLSVVGGNDIEASFAATLTQAKQWITAYLRATSAPFVYSGSLDACPDTYRTSVNCQAVNDDNDPAVRKTWTRADYVQLAYGLGPGRISVLPQIYFAEYPNIALQWTNVDLTAGGKLRFLGSLTEHALGCTDGPCTMTPAAGWATLWNALAAVGSPPPAVATDLDAVTG